MEIVTAPLAKRAPLRALYSVLFDFETENISKGLFHDRGIRVPERE
jgi:hypothetical protein